ncbi:hypothetical protein GGR57DRAFT_309454 [Xylariaceae sp. FL1272]|nr:hypothetical protein GGR57DRAFT_309454 [Xylariaceae sp. FL1272]
MFSRLSIRTRLTISIPRTRAAHWNSAWGFELGLLFVSASALDLMLKAEIPSRNHGSKTRHTLIEDGSRLTSSSSWFYCLANACFSSPVMNTTSSPTHPTMSSVPNTEDTTLHQSHFLSSFPSLSLCRCLSHSFSVVALPAG